MLRVLLVLLVAPTVLCQRTVETTVMRTMSTRFRTASIPYEIEFGSINDAISFDVQGDLERERLAELEEEKARLAAATGPPYYNKTIDQRGVIRFMRLFNQNPWRIHFHEIVYREVYEGKTLHEQVYRNLRFLSGYHESIRKYPFTLYNFSNPDITQEWEVVVGYENNTYCTLVPAVTRMEPNDVRHFTDITFNIWRKNKLIVQPPKSKWARAPLQKIDGRVIFNSPESLTEELNKVKTRLKVFQEEFIRNGTTPKFKLILHTQTKATTLQPNYTTVVMQKSPMRATPKRKRS